MIEPQKLFAESVRGQAIKRLTEGSIPIFDFQNGEIIKLEDLKFQEEIGQGAFSSVFKGTYQKRNVALKKIEFSKTDEDQTNLLVELSALRSLAHQNLVSFVGVTNVITATDHKKVLYIVMEICDKGTLRDNLNIKGNWDLRISAMRDVARSLSYLHEQKLIHRDVKTENIILDSSYRAKLCDLAFICHQNSESKLEYTFGTNEFMAPEVILAMDYDVSSDIFSFGIVLCEIITGKKPSDDFLSRHPRNCFELNEEELRNSILPDCPKGLEALTFRCCSASPEKRPTAAQCVEELDLMLIEIGLKTNSWPFDHSRFLSSFDSVTEPSAAVATGLVKSRSFRKPKQLQHSPSSSRIINVDDVFLDAEGRDLETELAQLKEENLRLKNELQHTQDLLRECQNSKINLSDSDSDPDESFMKPTVVKSPSRRIHFFPDDLSDDDDDPPPPPSETQLSVVPLTSIQKQECSELTSEDCEFLYKKLHVMHDSLKEKLSSWRNPFHSLTPLSPTVRFAPDEKVSASVADVKSQLLSLEIHLEEALSLVDLMLEGENKTSVNNNVEDTAISFQIPIQPSILKKTSDSIDDCFPSLNTKNDNKMMTEIDKSNTHEKLDELLNGQNRTKSNESNNSDDLQYSVFSDNPSFPAKTHEEPTYYDNTPKETKKKSNLEPAVMKFSMNLLDEISKLDNEYSQQVSSHNEYSENMQNLYSNEEMVVCDDDDQGDLGGSLPSSTGKRDFNRVLDSRDSPNLQKPFKSRTFSFQRKQRPQEEATQLSSAMHNFLEVINKCKETSSKSREIVSTLDETISTFNQDDHDSNFPINHSITPKLNRNLPTKMDLNLTNKQFKPVLQRSNSRTRSGNSRIDELSTPKHRNTPAALLNRASMESRDINNFEDGKNKSSRFRGTSGNIR